MPPSPEFRPPPKTPRGNKSLCLSVPTATGKPYSRSMCNISLAPRQRPLSQYAFARRRRRRGVSIPTAAAAYNIRNGNVALLSYASLSDGVVRSLYIYIFKYTKRYYVRAVYTYAAIPAPSSEKKNFFSFAAGSTPARHRDTLFSVARSRALDSYTYIYTFIHIYYIHGTILHRYVFV